VLLVRAVGGEEAWVPGEDSVLGTLLSLVGRDMIDHPESIQPLPMDLLARAERLVGGMQVNLDAPLDE
jgi:antitoxin PrlF